MDYSKWINLPVGNLLNHFRSQCEEWEITITIGTESRSPHEWLTLIEPVTLQGYITRIECSTVLRKLSTAVLNCHFNWHPHRHGWGTSQTGAVVHYYMPPEWTAHPGLGRPKRLLSLCSRSTVPLDIDFVTAGETVPSCKICERLHAQWNQPQP